MDPISSIERNIGIMARNNQALSSMLSQLAAGRPAADLRILLQDTAHIARETGELLLTAQQGLNTAPARQQAVLIKLDVARDMHGSFLPPPESQARGRIKTAI